MYFPTCQAQRACITPNPQFPMPGMMLLLTITRQHSVEVTWCPDVFWDWPAFIEWTDVSFSVLRRPWPKTDYSFLSNIYVKNEWRYTSPILLRMHTDSLSSFLPILPLYWKVLYIMGNLSSVFCNVRIHELYCLLGHTAKFKFFLITINCKIFTMQENLKYSNLKNNYLYR